MRLNLSVELRSVSAPFCPASTQIGFICCDEASSGWMCFHMWTLGGMGILQHGPIVQMQLTRDVLERCAFRVALTNGGPLLDAVTANLHPKGYPVAHPHTTVAD